MMFSRPVSLVVALVAALALAGCAAEADAGGDAAASTEHGADAAEGTAEPAAAEGGHGEAAGPATMPDDFPTDAVPLVEGELHAGSIAGGIWTIGLASRDVAADLAHATELLLDAGFEQTIAEALWGDFETPEYLVRVFVSEADESITYLVTSRIEPVAEEPAEEPAGDGGH